MKKAGTCCAIVLAAWSGAVLPCRAERADAIYRDGAFDMGEYIWHAALLYGYYIDDTPTLAVLQAAGQYENSVQINDFYHGTNNFLGSNVFMGRRSQGNPEFWRREIIIETGIYQLTADYWNGLLWKNPNSSFQSGDGNFRCDGVVEYCYESAGLNPCDDSELYPFGGPMYQFDCLNAAVQTPPTNVAMLYPSSTDIANPTIIPGTNFQLWASATDVHSGLANIHPFTYSYCSWTGTAWSAWTNTWQRNFYTAAYYRYYCWQVIAYDNDCMWKASELYYGYSVPAGSLQVGISPYTVVTNGARWRVDGGVWTNSWETIQGIQSDIYPHLVEFTSVTNWTTPPTQYVTISDGKTLVTNGVYVRHRGNLRTQIVPSEAYSYGARWQVDNGSWYTWDTTLQLDTGAHSINFGYVNGWDAPTNVSYVIAKDVTVTNVGVYARHTGAVGVSLYPSEAVAAGARWRVDGGTWTNSSAIIAGLNLGTHLIEFLPLTGWQEPSSIYSYIGTKGQTNLYSQSYAPRGAICFRLQPAEVATNGAAWFLSDGVARTNNETVGNLPAQSTYVWFRSVTGWLTPAPTYVTVLQGQTVTNTAPYPRNYASVRAFLYPANAVTDGAEWRVDGGAWTASGGTVSNLISGSYTIQFKPVVDWVPPADVPISLSPGQQFAISSSYTPAAYMTVYVSTNGGNIYPYTNWASAARAIQPAAHAVSVGGLVLVSNGVYASGAEIQITNAVTVRSVNGSGATIVAGSVTNRCFFLNHTGAAVDGLTLTNGHANLGGGAFLGAGGTLRNCLIRNCTASEYGGGVFLGPNGVVTRCTLRDNSAVSFDAGAVYLNQGGMVTESLLFSNSARLAGGAFLYNGGAMRNCLIYANTARGSSQGGGGVLCYLGSGTLDHCTIISNTAQSSGGGVYCNSGGVIRNSLVLFNTAPDSPNQNGAGTWVSCCTTPSIGDGCITADPLFQSPEQADYRLHPLSPCVNAGANLDWTASSVDLQGYPRKVGMSPDIGAYECTPTHYVALTGTHTSPFLAVSDAAVDIQSGVDAAEKGDTVIVAAGTYCPASAVVVALAARLQGAGAGQTFVSGNKTHRAFQLLTNAVLENVTVYDGYDGSTGGGIYASGGAIIRGCEVRDCTAWNIGGGGLFIEAGSAVSNSWVHHNRTVNGSGGGIAQQYGGTVAGTTVEANTGRWGGGIVCLSGCEVVNSVIRNNSCAHYGGGIEAQQNVSIRGCLVVGNSSVEFGGGLLVATTSTVANCTVADNVSPGGSVGGLVAIQSVRIENTVLWGNTGIGTSPNLLLSSNCTVSNSCAPGLSGNGCIASAPAFADESNKDYRLTVGSPCADCGALRNWMGTATDLDGVSRVVGTDVDMGAYELTPTHYALPTGGACAYPYTDWGTAADGIQDAVDAAGVGDTVIAGDGIFRIKEAVSITKRLTLEALHGASATTLSGPAEKGTRCLTASAAATVEGFTITGGWGKTGGGVALSDGASLRACVIKKNKAVNAGGGLLISGAGSANNCLIVSNTGEDYGGGAILENEGGRLFACTIASNTAAWGGGVALMEGGWLQNTLVANNEAKEAGGGIYATGGSVENCTVSRNTAPAASGVYCHYSDVWNTIVYYNVPHGDSEVLNDLGRWSYCCTPLEVGDAGQLDEPHFVDLDAGDYRLLAGSPCIDTARPGPSLDLGGMLRPLDGTPQGWPNWDIGAYEFMNPHADTDQDGMEDAWENANYSGPTNGVASADDDGDGASNREEFEADTNPHDLESRLRILAIDRSGDAMRVEWAGGSDSWQVVDSAATLAVLNWTPVCTQAPPTALTNFYFDSGRTNACGFYRIRARHQAPP